MIQENYEYLAEQLKYAGFPQELNAELEKQMKNGNQEFNIHHSTKYGEDEVKATLNFSKSKETEMFFFNNYDLELRKQGNAKEMKQTFYINQSGSITLKEGYNMMNGRAVNKNFLSKDPKMENGQPVLNAQGKPIHDTYNVWLQIDYKHTLENGNYMLSKFSEKYGFDIDKAIEKLPLKENSNIQYRDSVIDSLRKGNRQSVTFLIDGKEQKGYLEANPQFRTIRTFDEKHAKISVSKDKTQSKENQQSQNNGVNKTQQKASKEDHQIEDEGPDIPAKKKRRQPKVS